MVERICIWIIDNSNDEWDCKRQWRILNFINGGTPHPNPFKNLNITVQYTVMIGTLVGCNISYIQNGPVPSFYQLSWPPSVTLIQWICEFVSVNFFTTYHKGRQAPNPLNAPLAGITLARYEFALRTCTSRSYPNRCIKPVPVVVVSYSGLTFQLAHECR